MRSALYFPHTQIREEGFLKNSLLLWDDVEFISPTRHFHFDQDLPAHVREALELLCRAHMPTELEKRSAHSRIVKLLKDGIPNWLVTNEVPATMRHDRPVREFYGKDYGIYPEKLDHRTWVLLESAGLVKLSGADYDYYTRPLVGLYLMSLLANVCAGSLKEQITDRTEAYEFLWHLISAEAGAQFMSPQTSGSTGDLDRLVAVSLKAINTDAIPFKNIMELRRREARESGRDYRAFRVKYGEMLKKCATDIATKAKTVGDRKELERQFALALKDDLASLKDALGVAKRDIILSKEVITAVVAGGALFVEPVSASVLFSTAAKSIAAGAFLKDFGKFEGSYRKALADHSTSWLYLAQNPRTRDLPIRRFGRGS